MIVLKKMKWSNPFSYGENNEINFDSSPLTQIVGGNGHGKSSIALILEEVLYNKNSKGIKKADILNRNVKAKNYSIELEFGKDDSTYVIKTVRGATQTVKLTCDGEDISSHTSTATYKTIEELIGYDHKTFCQIVYQSSSASLEFLTATDGNRKKFLIDLLNLTKYVELGDVFKGLATGVDKAVTAANAKIASCDDWLKKYRAADLTKQEVQPVPDQPKELEEVCQTVRDTLRDIEAKNKAIVQNNKYKELLESLVLQPVGAKPGSQIPEYTREKIELAKTVKDCDSFISKMGKLGSVCPTCLQDIDKHKIDDLLEEQRSSKTSASVRVQELEALIRNLELEVKEWEKLNETKELYEEYHALYDHNITSELLDKKTLEQTIKSTEASIQQVKDTIKKITDSNSKAIAHNAKVDVILSQLEEMEASLVVHRGELEEASARLSTLQVLVKTFSPTGLVAYKIECLVKDLESTTNEYLGELSGGRFQLGFRIAGSDKLNVVITDQGKDIEILALSGGERARVNAAALLGIRKLMQSLSNTRINLLILDETIENLDLEGKEKLVEVLLKEEYLNTFVVSHGFQHPLLEKVTVIKQNNISRIDNG
jgi:DNA repair exonuclease SbcCD ATPase subunit